jgi:hypothetical protein
MKNMTILKSLILLVVVSTLSSCEAVAGIFKAGMNFGIFIVIAVIAVIIFIITRLFRTKNP